MEKITKDNVSDHVDHLINIADSIDFGKVTILTGSNGLGKSFIRKIVGFKLADKRGLDRTKPIVASTSMAQRTGSNPEWGAMSGIMRDDDWTPTSTETLSKIKNLIKIKDRYIVIDEPEIGMSEEMILALCKYINENIVLDDEFMGLMVITHSRLIVNNLKHHVFINIDGLGEYHWMTRQPIPVNLDEIEERSLIIFREIQDRLNNK